MSDQYRGFQARWMCGGEGPLRKPEDWAESMSITIIDPDGWRIDGKDFEEPVTFEEFERRLIPSTIQIGVGP